MRDRPRRGTPKPHPKPLACCDSSCSHPIRSPPDERFHEATRARDRVPLLGVGIAGGSQIGYASLVDLNDGRIVWFNDLRRASGDLREAEPAKETVEVLLKGFPVSQ